jgi:DNA-binding HxlR family transcriptional regulator
MAVKNRKEHHDCLVKLKPVQDALNVLNGKWKLPIIISINVGNERFTDIQDSIPGITPKVLVKELKELEAHKIIRRTVVGEYPVKIMYTPEPYMYTLNPVISALKDWGELHRNTINSAT